MTEDTKNDITATTATEKPIELVRKFELAVYEEDVREDGSVKWNQVSYKQPVIIEARNKEELNEKLSFYKQCGQRAKIVREVDPPSKEQIEAYINQQKNNNAVPGKTNKTNVSNETVQTQIEKPILKVQAPTCNKPKYYKVGDIEIKDDNGKIYQKQWMKLSDTEASNIRLINDKNNALVNINGKHFEMKRWILVETTDLDESSQLEECLK